MKKIILVALAALLFISCGTIPTTNTNFNLKHKGNEYSASFSDNTETKHCAVAVTYKGKTYKCEVDYTTAAPDAIGFKFDFDTIDITGKISVTYKTVEVECTIEGDNPTVDPEKSTIEIVESAAGPKEEVKPEESKEEEVKTE